MALAPMVSTQAATADNVSRCDAIECVHFFSATVLPGRSACMAKQVGRWPCQSDTVLADVSNHVRWKASSSTRRPGSSQRTSRTSGTVAVVLSGYFGITRPARRNLRLPRRPSPATSPQFPHDPGDCLRCTAWQRGTARRSPRYARAAYRSLSASSTLPPRHGRDQRDDRGTAGRHRRRPGIAETPS